MTRITDIGLKTWAEYYLVRAGIEYEEELLKMDDKEILSIYGIGPVALLDINKLLASRHSERV